jgi:hypothetical protein
MRRKHPAAVVERLFEPLGMTGSSLGEALVAAGEPARAIKAYERSVELDAAVAGGIEALNRLRSGAGRRP